MADASQFGADLRRFGQKVEDVVLDIHKELTLETRERIAKRTPILTGRASASWNASVNVPDTETKPTDYLNPAGAPFDGNQRVDGARLGDAFYVTNAVPYIGNLNAGSSQKAPAGFVEATAVEIEGALPRVVDRVKKKNGL